MDFPPCRGLREFLDACAIEVVHVRTGDFDKTRLDGLHRGRGRVLGISEADAQGAAIRTTADNLRICFPFHGDAECDNSALFAVVVVRLPAGKRDLLRSAHDRRLTHAPLDHHAIDDAAERTANEGRSPEQPEPLDIGHPREEGRAVLRAGLTDVLVTGILPGESASTRARSRCRRIRRARAMRRAEDDDQEHERHHHLGTIAAPMLYPPGESEPKPFEAKPAETSNPGRPLAMK